MDILTRRGEAGGRGIDDDDMATTELGQGWDRAREGRGRKQRELGFRGGVPVLSRARGAVDARHGAMVCVDMLHDASLLQGDENQCGLGFCAL